MITRRDWLAASAAFAAAAAIGPQTASTQSARRLKVAIRREDRDVRGSAPPSPAAFARLSPEGLPVPGPIDGVIKLSRSYPQIVNGGLIFSFLVTPVLKRQFPCDDELSEGDAYCPSKATFSALFRDKQEAGAVGTVHLASVHLRYT
jgi:hypothetical protein